MKPLRQSVQLLFLMMKIGLFTFGGGYAMLSLLEHEFVARRAWMSADEFADMVSISESTPGPLAINAATYLGYRRAGTLGALAATVGVCIPSFGILYLISLFLDRFLAVPLIAAAFRGVRVCVIFLIFSAGVKFFRQLKKTPCNLVLFFATFGCMTAFSLFGVNFSSIFYLLIAGAVGLAIYLIGLLRAKRRKPKERT